MAFNLTSQPPTRIEVVGNVAPQEWGIVALAAGVATVTIPRFYVVQAAFVSAQSANAAYVSAISGNTFTITGTGTDNVMWTAIGTGGA